MAETTNIAWADATVNFWVGCKKVSEACKYCYMFRDFGGKYGNDPKRVKRTANNTFNAALKWKEPKRIFTCSWSDFFIEDADGFRDAAWDVIRQTQHHTWLILTKRPERIKQCLPPDWGQNGWPRVWIGVSVENQQRADERLPIMETFPAAVKFISAEPLLGPIDLNPWIQPRIKSVPGGLMSSAAIQWVIIGGESGNENGLWKYRDCDTGWMTRIVADCERAMCPVFVKQMGTAIAKRNMFKSRHGTDIAEFPPQLQIQQFPIDYETFG